MFEKDITLDDWKVGWFWEHPSENGEARVLAAAFNLGDIYRHGDNPDDIGDVGNIDGFRIIWVKMVRQPGVRWL